MKKILVFPFLFLVMICNGQEHKKIFSINYGFGQPISFRDKESSGGVGCGCVIFKEEIKPLKTFGFGYLYQTNKHLFIETGLSYSQYKNEDNSINDEDNLLNVLVKLRHTFGKYIFLNYGLSIDVGISSSKFYGQNNYAGLGASLGLGGQYHFKNNLGVFILPNLNYSGLISSEAQNRNSSRPLSLYSNVNLGLTYTFNNAKAYSQNP
ncbi:outer membrane beta-barrel protein [Pedobacter sp. Du54]|uniref:outer membrane beta-barrel protein n=1 Tax=Pedobacter anseongensis TaxID=3133439 RepID=UPI0030A57256